MAKKPRIKLEAADLKIPQSRDEAAEYIAEIGRLQRQRQRIEADMNDEIARIKERFETQAQPLGDDIRQLTKGVQTWCEANRVQLTGGGKVKFAQLPTGKINWRTRPPKVNLKNKEIIIETLKRLGLQRFIRVTEDVNKEAMLAEPEVATSVTGVSITQGEDFVITPFETELDEVA